MRPGLLALRRVWRFGGMMYDPMSKENEAQSAVLARDHLTQLSAPTDLTAQTCALIFATQNHFTAPRFGDDEVLLDADIAILGAPHDVYARYTAQIRAEYHIVPAPLFAAGRTRFLQGAAGWSRIFKTDVFETAYGDQARANLAWEL
jgi:predicted metal-dependent HD superfamily phosphohydrolase